MVILSGLVVDLLVKANSSRSRGNVFDFTHNRRLSIVRCAPNPYITVELEAIKPLSEVFDHLISPHFAVGYYVDARELVLLDHEEHRIIKPLLKLRLGYFTFIIHSNGLL